MLKENNMIFERYVSALKESQDNSRVDLLASEIASKIMSNQDYTDMAEMHASLIEQNRSEFFDKLRAQFQGEEMQFRDIMERINTIVNHAMGSRSEKRARDLKDPNFVDWKG